MVAIAKPYVSRYYKSIKDAQRCILNEPLLRVENIIPVDQ